MALRATGKSRTTADKLFGKLVVIHHGRRFRCRSRNLISLAHQTANRNPFTFALGGDLTINCMGYGAMRITGDGIWGPPKDHDEAIRVLRRAVELGVNFIDTADSYGPNLSEELIAEALYPYAEGLIIGTKGWHSLAPTSGPWMPAPNT